MIYYAAQAVGFLGMAVVIYTFQQNRQKRISAFQGLTCLIFAIHFTMLGAVSGMAMNAVGVVRSCVFTFKSEKRWASHKWWPFVFCGISVVLAVVFWNDWWSLLTLAAMIFTSFSLWADNPVVVRALTLPASWLWLAYNIHSGSWAGIATELFSTSSILIAFLRYDILPRYENKTKKINITR